MASYITDVFKRLAGKVKRSFTPSSGAGSPETPPSSTTSIVDIKIDVVDALNTIGRAQCGVLAYVLSQKERTIMPRSDSQQTLVDAVDVVVVVDDAKPKLSTATKADRAFALARLEARVAPLSDADYPSDYDGFKVANDFLAAWFAGIDYNYTSEEIATIRQRALDCLEGKVEAAVDDDRLSYNSDITLDEPAAVEAPVESDEAVTPPQAIPTLKRKQRISRLHARALSVSSDADELDAMAEAILSAPSAVTSTPTAEDILPRTLKRKPAFNFSHC